MTSIELTKEFSSEEEMRLYIYRIASEDKLTPMEYKVLCAFAPYPTVGTSERKEICQRLSIGQYNLNNVISRLKKKNLLLKTEERKYYVWEKPDTTGEVVIRHNLKTKRNE